MTALHDLDRIAVLALDECLAVEAKLLVLIAPPGSGAVGVARRISEDLRMLVEPGSLQDAVLRWLYSGVGMPMPPHEQGRSAYRVLRAPHFSCSDLGLIGNGCANGQPWQPGELFLAAGGVLLLDAAVEFRRTSLAALVRELDVWHRSALRATGVPGHLLRPRLVIATHTPCPCGFRPGDRCTCTEAQVRKHRERLSVLTDSLAPSITTIL